MKVIDLLNKIANGEELPKKIYCYNREFYLNANTYFGDTFTLMHYIQEEDLNEQVEIIEEEKKIPDILIPTSLKGIDDLDEKIEIAHLDTISAIGTINEIIDYLKSKGDE